MKRRSSLFALIGLALAMLAVLVSQDSDQTPNYAVMQAVGAVFPKELRYPKDQESGNDYSTCAAVFSRDMLTVRQVLSRLHIAEMATKLRCSPTHQARRTADSGRRHLPQAQFGLEGGACGLGIDNLADPEHPGSSLARAIEVSFHDGPSWFFTWDGKTFQNITSLKYEFGSQDVPNSAMANTDVVDIDHSGPMQIVGKNGDEEKVAKR